MIASCTKFYFQPPHLDPTYRVFVIELIDGNGGGEQALVCLAEHRIHLIRRGGQKEADMLPGHTAVQFQHAEHAIKRGERA